MRLIVSIHWLISHISCYTCITIAIISKLKFIFIWLIDILCILVITFSINMNFMYINILCQFFNLIVVSGLTTYLGLATTGKNATTAMSLLAGIEGSGVFLCGYIVPVVGNLFGGGAGMNIMVSGIILMVIGVAAYFVIKPTHEMVYGKKNTDQQHG